MFRFVARWIRSAARWIRFAASVKNKLSKMRKFRMLEKHHSSHHDLPAIHHKLTTKNHALHLNFPKNP
jgi:hypothetical protein